MNHLEPRQEVVEYLAGLTGPVRGTLEKLRLDLRAAAPPEATEELHHGMPVFRWKGVLVGYAACEHYCAFYPMSLTLLDEFAEDLAGYSTAQGAIRFPLNEPLPSALVKKMVRARVKENEAK